MLQIVLTANFGTSPLLSSYLAIWRSFTHPYLPGALYGRKARPHFK
jgi:hypothetical protein